ncbi:MAG: response regulator transcription factor [Bacteroidetes bacterium]|nr:response regulator transcription factor [Bacteroidota bacterium]
MKVLISEDEKLNADHLVSLLNRIDPTIEVLGIFDSVKRTVEYLSKNPEPDLLLLDIHLADGLSFDIFNQISSDIPVIFTTAFDEYAIKAFKVNSIDYLLKPIGKDELSDALEKARRLKKEPLTPNLIEALGSALQNANRQFKSRFMVKMGESISSVRVEEILYFIAEDGIVLLVKNDGKRFPLDYTLDQIERMIDPTEFFRISRKVLVAFSSIKKVSPYFNSRFRVSVDHLSDDDGIVSRERASDFKFWLDK